MHFWLFVAAVIALTACGLEPNKTSLGNGVMSPQLLKPEDYPRAPMPR